MDGFMDGFDDMGQIEGLWRFNCGGQPRWEPNPYFRGKRTVDDKGRSLPELEPWPADPGAPKPDPFHLKLSPILRVYMQKFFGLSDPWPVDPQAPKPLFSYGSTGFGGYPGWRKSVYKEQLKPFDDLIPTLLFPRSPEVINEPWPEWNLETWRKATKDAGMIPAPGQYPVFNYDTEALVLSYGSRYGKTAAAKLFTQQPKEKTMPISKKEQIAILKCRVKSLEGKLLAVKESHDDLAARFSEYIGKNLQRTYSGQFFEKMPPDVYPKEGEMFFGLISGNKKAILWRSGGHWWASKAGCERMSFAEDEIICWYK